MPSLYSPEIANYIFKKPKKEFAKVIPWHGGWTIQLSNNHLYTASFVFNNVKYDLYNQGFWCSPLNILNICPNIVNSFGFSSNNTTFCDLAPITFLCEAINDTIKASH